jgi:hypothetical protein
MSPVVSDWKTLTLLVVVRTYPEISIKNGEISCTAGVDENGDWYRIYPVPYRDLKANQKFKKWQWITVEAAKHSDPRPESYMVRPDTIRLGEILDPRKAKDLRKKYLSPGTFKSLHDMEMKGKTLGAFLPKTVMDLKITETESNRSIQQEGKISQINWLSQSKTELKRKVISTKFVFKCDDGLCPPKGHAIEMIDWEMHQSYFNWLKVYGSDEVVRKKLRDKWLTQHHIKRKTYFIAGMHSRFPTWILIGYYSLELHEKLEQYQERLF